MKTDKHDVSFPLAVWLSFDDYEYDSRENHISASTIIKPLRQLILKIREKNNKADYDITDMLKAKIGSAIHLVNDFAWADKHTIIKALIAKDEDPALVDRFRLNGNYIVDRPNTDEAPIDIWIEQREEKKLGEFIISGKYDIIWYGRLADTKSTSTFTYVKRTKDEDYILQGSIYRWLNPDKVTEDTINIQFIFTDWMQRMVGTEGYPDSPVLEYTLPLMSLKDTEAYLKTKLKDLVAGLILPDKQLPRCSEKDLWITDEVWQYFTKSTNTRASKNFHNQKDAYAFMGNKGGVGEVRKKPQKAKACNYCDVAHTCSQYRELLTQNLI